MLLSNISVNPYAWCTWYTMPNPFFELSVTPACARWWPPRVLPGLVLSLCHSLHVVLIPSMYKVCTRPPTFDTDRFVMHLNAHLTDIFPRSISGARHLKNLDGGNSPHRPVSSSYNWDAHSQTSMTFMPAMTEPLSRPNTRRTQE